MLPSFPPEDVEIVIAIDEDGKFRVMPSARWVAGPGTLRFKTNGTTAAQVHIPDTKIVYEDAPGPGSLVFKLGLTDEKVLRAADDKVELPYSVFRIEDGKVEESTEQAPVIIIVKTSSRNEDV